MHTEILIDNDYMTLTTIPPAVAQSDVGPFDRGNCYRLAVKQGLSAIEGRAPTTVEAIIAAGLVAARDHLAREVRSSQALLARVAELESLLKAERMARIVEVDLITESHGAEVADLKARLDASAMHAERLAADLGEARVSLLHKSTRIREHEMAMDGDAEQRAANMRLAAREHAREVIWSWRNEERYVPHDWTAAHPPDDRAAQIMATFLGDDGFAAYSEAFRAAWREQVEAIADAREVRHGSGKVKL